MNEANGKEVQALNAQGQDWHPFVLPASKLKAAIALALGAVLLRLRPERAKILQAAAFDQFTDLSRADRWMLLAMGVQASRSGNLQSLQLLHRKYWNSAEGAQMHQHYADRFETEFLKDHKEIAQWLREAAQAQGIRKLVEFGCGRGEVLRYCVEQAGFLRATGVDLSSQLLDIARAQTTGENMQFECADVMDWMRDRAAPETAFLTNGGVLEYFTAEQLEEIFSTIAAVARPAIFALVEPVSPDHDLVAKPKSLAHGAERSFSHPYAHLLEQAGFTVLRSKDYRPPSGGRWIMLIAQVVL